MNAYSVSTAEAQHLADAARKQKNIDSYCDAFRRRLKGGALVLARGAAPPPPSGPLAASLPASAPINVATTSTHTAAASGLPLSYGTRVNGTRPAQVRIGGFSQAYFKPCWDALTL